MISSKILYSIKGNLIKESHVLESAKKIIE